MGPVESAEGSRQSKEDSNLLSEVLELGGGGDGEDGTRSKEDICLLEQRKQFTPQSAASPTHHRH